MEIKIEKDYTIQIPFDIMEQLGFKEDMDFYIECIGEDGFVIKKVKV